jgi:hypothetical protein
MLAARLVALRRRNADVLGASHALPHGIHAQQAEVPDLQAPPFTDVQAPSFVDGGKRKSPMPVHDCESEADSVDGGVITAGAFFKVRKLRQSVSDVSSRFDDLDVSAHCAPECEHWVRIVRNAVARKWDAMMPLLLRPILYATACTCLGTCIASARSVGIPLEKDMWASDVNRNSCDFVVANYPELQHVWASMAAQSSGVGHCAKTGGFARADLKTRPRRDIMVIGAPCQPFSANSIQSKKPQGCEAHPLYEATFGESACETSSGLGCVLDVVAAETPSALVFENVIEFLKADPRSGRIPVDIFIEKLKRIKNMVGAQHFTAFHVFNLDSKLWINQTRARRCALDCYYRIRHVIYSAMICCLGQAPRIYNACFNSIPIYGHLGSSYFGSRFFNARRKVCNWENARFCISIEHSCSSTHP